MKKIMTVWLMAMCCLMQVTAQENEQENEQVTVASEDSLTIDNYMEYVNNYLQANELEKALSCYDILLKPDSDNAVLNYEKSYLLSLDNRYEEALQYALKARALCPDTISYLYWSWYCYDELAMYDQLQTEIDSMMALQGDSTRLLLIKAQVLSARRDYGQSAAICKNVLSTPALSKKERLSAYDILLRTRTLSSKETQAAVDSMLAAVGSDNYDAMELAVIACNSVSNYKQAEKYKKKVYALRDQYGIEDQVFQVDQYVHSNSLVKVYQYFNPADAGWMPLFYLFDVYEFKDGKYRYQYKIRVEKVRNIGKGPEKAVMATLKDDGFRTFWDTYSEVKKTSYGQWKAFAEKIMDDALEVGSATLKE